MNITKKLLAAAFSILVLPTTIHAANVNVENADQLYDAVKVSGDEVVLNSDISANVVIEEGITMTIDLNGYTLSNVDSHTIVNSGTLTIKDSSADKTGTVDNITHAKATIDNQNGTVVLDGGTFTRSLETGTSPTSGGKNTYYTIKNAKGKMTINENVTVLQDGSYSSLITNGATPYVGSELIINGGTFNGGLNTIKNDELGKLTINGGKFINTTQASIFNWYEATINAGEFSSTGVVLINGFDPTCKTKGILTVNGGTFTGKNIFDNIGDKTVLTVTGGTYEASESVFTDEEYPTLIIKNNVFANDEDATIETSSEEVTEIEEADKTLFEEKLPEDSTLVGYFDIKAFIKETNSEVNITELENNLKISIDLPTTIEDVKEGYTRKYYVARKHDGVVELIDATLNGNKVEFETNKFSTYAISYIDTKEEVVVPTDKEEVNPDTGINFGSYILILLAGLAFGSATLKLRKN